METKLLVRFIIRETLGLVIMGVALFWPAGRLDWWPAWAALAVMFCWILATLVVLLHLHPGLLAERLGPRKGAKSWDTAIMSVLGLLQLGRYIIAGFDRRHGWTEGIPLAEQIAALAICAAGYTLVTWATAANAFFSQINRLQPERGHSVATGGPYGFVRHPAYLGAVLYELAVPVLLASWWAGLPSILNAGLLILRTYLEDRALRAELEGYPEYAHQVPYRLLPGVW